MASSFRRMRRDDLGDPDPDRRRPPDEVDVLEPALHNIGEHAVVPVHLVPVLLVPVLLVPERGRGQRGGVADIGVRGR